MGSRLVEAGDTRRLCSSVEKAPYCRSLLSDQLPFHFRDPRDPRIDALRADLDKAVYAPDVLRAAAANDYGAIEVQDFRKLSSSSSTTAPT